MKKSIQFLLLGSLVVPSLLFAQAKKPTGTTPPKDAPETLVLSDSLSYNDATKTSEFKGNVILTRGLLRLTSDELHLQEDKKGFQHGQAIMKKNPKVTVYEERPDNYETIYAEGNTATYNGETEVIKLIGQAIVIRHVCGQAIDNLRGDTITYNSKEATYFAEGGPASPEKGRVRSVVQSRAKVDALVAECRKKYNGKPMPSTINKK